MATWSNLGPSPGGSPGSCSNGRVGFTCAECPRGTFASLEGRCAQCAEGSQALWMTLGCEMVVMLEDLRNCWLIWVDLLKCDVFIFLKVPCDVFDFLFQRYWIYRGKWSTTSSSTLGYSLRFWLCFNKGDVMLFSMGTRAFFGCLFFIKFAFVQRWARNRSVRTSWGYRKRFIKPGGTQPTNSMTGDSPTGPTENNQIPGHQGLTFYESPKIGTLFLPG